MVDVFCCNSGLDLSTKVLQRIESLVSIDRVQRSRRFLRRDDRIRCLLAELLAIYALSAVACLERGEYRFSTDDNGRPILEGAGDVHFSLTHAGAWIGCVISDRPVGMDIVRRKQSYPDVTQGLFGEHERDFVVSTPDERSRRERFYSVWAAKESYVKAIGKGLGYPLRSFSTCGPSGIGDVSGPDGAPTGFTVRVTSLDEDHVCSVCSQLSSGIPSYTTLSDEDLVAKLVAV